MDESVVCEEPVEAMWSQDRWLRTTIYRRGDGHFSVELERLVPGDAEYEEPPHWGRVGHGVVLTDTLDRAREIACELLGSFSFPSSA